MSDMLGQDKPSLEELSHHGVKGMHWGVRRDPHTGVRPIARSLNDSKFGKASAANVDRHNRNASSGYSTKRKVANVALLGAAGVYMNRLNAQQHATANRGKSEAAKVMASSGSTPVHSKDRKTVARYSTGRQVTNVALFGVAGIIANNRNEKKAAGNG